MADTLHTLLRLRRLAVDKAQRGLAECLREEAAAEVRMREVEESIHREAEAVVHTMGDDRLVADFALWLRRARGEQALAANALLTAQTHTQEARAVMTAGREAVEQVLSLIARKDAERMAVLQRQEQAVLDEVGQRRKSTGRD